MEIAENRPESKTLLVNRLMKEALGTGPGAIAAGAQVRELLGLDELNWSYFLCLYRNSATGAKIQSVRIFEEGREHGNQRIAYPVAIAAPRLLAQLRKVEYAELKNSSEHYERAAANVALWVKKMQAGTGSSLTRSTYLAKRRGVALGKSGSGPKERIS